jgi:hypothetical protein
VGNGNSASVLSKVPQNPVKSGVAAPNGDRESEGQGRSSVREDCDLQGMERCLKDIKGQLVAGLKRMEDALLLLGQRERLGCVRKTGVLGPGISNSRTKQQMGIKRYNEGMGWSKPKKKTFRSIKSNPGLLGPKPSMDSGNLPQGPGPKSSFSYRALSHLPSKECRQAGESSAMGAARASGGDGSMIAGVFTGDHFSGAGNASSDSAATTRETENDGEHNGVDEIGVVSPPEGADGLGFVLSSPEKGYMMPVSSTSLMSTIPESDVVLGHTKLSPVKSAKCRSGYSGQAGDEDIESFTPEKQPRQMLVFQRRESPYSKTTKSWVAERVSWNGDRGCSMPTVVKKLNSCLDTEEALANVVSMLGENEELGLLGGLRSQEITSPGVEGSISQHDVEISSEEQPVQGLLLASPASKVYKLAWEVKGTTGMTWEEQEGKLEQIFGQIVADKYGEGASSATGVAADGNMGRRDDDITYEA